MARERPAPRTVEVLRKAQITPHMLRITFGGEGLAGFPEDQDSAYIKFRLVDQTGDAEAKPLVRTYTVRHFDAEALELDVDFVLHASEGPAARWATDCQPGDLIGMMGPGPKKLVDVTADWFLLVGDMSALPAISANVEALPATARGYAVLEIIDEHDRQPLPFPPGMRVHWVVNPDPEAPHTLLLDEVKKLKHLDGRPSIWVAGEFTQSLAIRAHLKNDRGVDRQDLYASSYWQIGRSEDEHRVSKRGAADD